MKIEVKNTEKCWQEMTIIIPAEEAEKEYRKVVNSFKNKVNIPGFRKGKAPLSVMERTYGEYFKEEFLQKAAEKFYKLALDEKDINPISEADLKKVEWEHDKDLVAEFRFEIFPEIELTQYENFEVEFHAQEMQDEFIDLTIEDMRKSNAIQEDSEKPAELENIVIARFNQVTEEGEGFKFERTFAIGDNVYNSDLNKKIVGKKIGEEFVSSIFDKDTEHVAQADEKFRGKEFKVVIDSIKVNILPELDEEFAKDNDFDTLEEMKTKLSADIQTQVDKENFEAKRKAIMDKLVELNPIEMPDSMIEQYAKQLGKDAAKQYNLPIDQATKIFKPMAEQNMKSFHIQNRIMELLEITISDEDKQAAIAEAAENMKMPAEEYASLYAKELAGNDFIEALKEKKTVDFLLKTVTFIEPKPVEEEPEEQVSE